MRIRAITPEDKKEVSQLYYKLHPEVKKKKPLPIDQFSAETKILVAEEDDKTVGFIWSTFIRYGFSRIGYIEELYVEKEKRRKGIGTRLVNQALNYFKKLKTEVVFVSISLQDKEALKFYKKLNFEKCKGYWLYKKPV